MLKEFLKGKNKSAFARDIGISFQHLQNILNDKSPKLSVLTAMKIKELTGLEPWNYLDGLDFIKNLVGKNQK